MAVCIFASAPTLFADSGADAVILNVVRVDYTDASGNQNFSAEAASMVTVSLVEASVTISGRPTSTDRGTSAAVPSEQTVSSGSIASYLYAITSNANGDDQYFLGVAIDAIANTANQSLTTQLLSPDESSVIATNPASVTLEASVVIDAPAADTLHFPGGTFSGLAAGEVLVVDGIDYLVSSVTAGSAASHTYADGSAHSDLGALTAELPVQVVLAANPSGGNIVPAFDGTFVGMSAYEQVLLSVQVSAEADTVGTDGTVNVDLRTATDAAFTANLVDLQDVTTTYTAVNLTIQKLVRNVTANGAFAATAAGGTGDVLEYQVTVVNNGGDAANVIVTDTVPDYTTLVVSGLNFATYIDPGLNSGNVSTAADNENADAVSGDNAGGTAAGVPLTFYVGQGQAGSTSTGGSVLNGETFVITYQVSIN